MNRFEDPNMSAGTPNLGVPPPPPVQPPPPQGMQRLTVAQRVHQLGSGLNLMIPGQMASVNVNALRRVINTLAQLEFLSVNLAGAYQDLADPALEEAAQTRLTTIIGQLSQVAGISLGLISPPS